MRAGSVTRGVAVSGFLLIAHLALAVGASASGDTQAESVAGRVVGANAAPVEGAWVRVEDGSEVVRTDAAGRFALPLAPPLAPRLVLRVTHPEFEERVFEIEVPPTDGLEIVLATRGSVVRDEIAVSASRSQGSFSPQSSATSVITPDQVSGQPNALTALAAEAPGVSQNGQGGLFQTYSVRGVSRQRVLTLVEGMRIVGERRAGVSASFLDPLLLGSVEIVRGPASTYWGSGALGGVVQLFPRRFAGLTAATGYSTDGDERYLRLGYGQDFDAAAASPGTGRWSWGIAARNAGAAETPRGETLPSGFEQVSATAALSWERRRTTYDALLVASAGRDIGKANADFPDRTTTYPTESHLLARLSARRDDGWSFSMWAHPNELETRFEQLDAEVSLVDNEAFDWGLDAQRELRLSNRRTLRVGVDWFARDGLSSRETVRDGEDRLVLEQETLSNAAEQELGVYGAFEAGVGRSRADDGSGAVDRAGSRATLLAGGRLVLQRQTNAEAVGSPPSSEDSAATAFLGAVVPLRKGYELTANLGTGLRFPSISERFFSGSTGRGFVTGNPSLEPESSLSADLGLRWTGERTFVSASVFRNGVDDYIERVETTADRLTFVNLASGKITGIELEGAWEGPGSWRLSYGGHAIAGEDDTGGDLADIPPKRVHLDWSYRGSGSVGWTWRGRWERRFRKDDIGSGEKVIPEADLLSTSFAWRRSRTSRTSRTSRYLVRFSVRNLLDESYFNAADRKVTLSPGRSIAVAVEWN